MLYSFIKYFIFVKIICENRPLPILCDLFIWTDRPIRFSVRRWRYKPYNLPLCLNISFLLRLSTALYRCVRWILHVLNTQFSCGREYGWPRCFAVDPTGRLRCLDKATWFRGYSAHVPPADVLEAGRVTNTAHKAPCPPRLSGEQQQRAHCWGSVHGV